MLRFVTLFCAAIILTGCGPTLTGLTFQNPSPDQNMISGYGKGDVTTATNEAWKDARRKLDISGLGQRYGLSEFRSEWKHGTAAILFKLVPLDETESDSNSKDLPKNIPPSNTDSD